MLYSVLKIWLANVGDEGFCSSNHHSRGKLFASHNVWFYKSRLTVLWNRKKKSVRRLQEWNFSIALDTDCFMEIIPLEPLYSPWLLTHVLYFVTRSFLLARFEWCHDLLDIFRECFALLFMYTKHFYPLKYNKILMKRCTAVIEWLTHGNWDPQFKDIFNAKKI